MNRTIKRLARRKRVSLRTWLSAKCGNLVYDRLLRRQPPRNDRGFYSSSAAIAESRSSNGNSSRRQVSLGYSNNNSSRPPLIKRRSGIHKKKLNTRYLLPNTKSRYALLFFATLILLLGPIAFFTLNKPTQTEASWFDDSFGFRKRIPISNASGTEQTDFQVELTLDTATLITAEKLQDDCDDLRFTASNGKVLPYWLEPNTCNTSTTKVFVKVPKIPTSGADIFWYYGNPQANSASQADQTFIKEIDGPVAAWPLDDEEQTQSYARVVNDYVEEGRDIVINGGFDSDTNWTKGTGWSIENGVAHSDGTGTGTNIRNSPDPDLVQGKPYQVTFTISNYVSGAVYVYLGAGIGTTRSSNGTFSETIIAGNNNLAQIATSPTFIGDIDNFEVKQVNIPSSATLSTNLLTDGDMEASDTSAWTAGANATLTKETTSPQQETQNLKIARSSTNNPNASQSGIMTVGKVYRISGYARSDGNATPRIINGSPVIWSGNQSTSWQPFDFLHVATSTNIVLQSLNADSGTEYTEWDNITITEDTGLRPGELLQDGDMEASGTGVWNGVAATVEKDNTVSNGGSNSLKITRTSSAGRSTQTILTTGKTYRATGWWLSDGTNSFTLYGGSGTPTYSDTTISGTWRSFDVTFIASGTAIGYGVQGTTGNSIYIDDISVTEVSPLIGKPTNGVTIGVDSNGHLSKAYSFDGTNDNVNIYSSDLNAVFNPNEGTLVAWAKVSDAGVWSDGQVRRFMNFTFETSNDRILINKGSGNNTLEFYHIAGGKTRSIIPSFSSNNWFQVVFTWNNKSDQVIAYINGSQVGVTQTNIGNIMGNLLSTHAVIGAQHSGGLTPWKGLMNDFRLYDRALTADEIADMYSDESDIQVYGTDNYSGKELIRKYNTAITVGTLADEEIGAAPIAYWNFDEGQGQTVADSSNNGNDGVLGTTSGSESSDPTWQAEDQCVSGKCLSFDGTDDYVNVDNVVSEVETISFWAKPMSDTEQLININGTASISLNSGTVTATGFTSPTIYVQGVVNQAPTPNAWNHIVVTTDTTIYGSDITIGKINTDYGNVFIDEVKIYPYARSAAQVREDYNQGAAAIAKRTTFMSDGLVGYWKMDEASWNGTAGEVKDASGNGNNLTSYYSTTTAGGKFGNSGSFNGTSNYIGLVDNGKLNPTKYTLSAWIKSTHVEGISGAILVRGSWGSPGGTYAIHRVPNQQRVYFSFYGSPTNCSAYFDFSLADGGWHHLTITYDQENIRAYRDGKPTTYNGGGSSTQVPCTSIPNTGNSLVTLGANPSSLGGSAVQYFTGGLDEVRIYNRALSPDEVKDLYNYAPGPIGYWNFDEGEGTTAFDKSGNGNNGTLTNGPTWTEGKYGNALSFDGVDDWIDTTDIDVIGNITVQAWVKAEDGQRILSKYQAASNVQMEIRMTDGKATAYLYCSGIGTVTTTSSTSLLDGLWHHIVGVREAGTNIYIYVDGKLENQQSDPCPNDLSNNNNYGIGSGPQNTGTKFKGIIDDVKIYNYARTQEQILQDMGGSGGDPSASSGKVLPDPVAWYRFDEQSGQTVKNFGIGGTSLNGTLGANSGASTDDPTWKTKADCKVNGCLSFDGGDRVTLGSANVLGTTDQLTISTWIKSSVSVGALFGEYLEDGSQTRNYLHLSSGSVRFDQYNPVAGALTSTQTVHDNQWHHIVYTQSGNNRAIYIDGKLNISDSNAETYTGPSPAVARLGYRGTGANDYYSGILDELKIYNVALTEDQVRQDYNAGAVVNFGSTSNSEATLLNDGAGAPPVAHWSFDEKTGTVANDKSGNGNMGTISGATWTSGKYGSALKFDGVDDQVNVTDTSGVLNFTEANSLSVSTWFKRTGTNANDVWPIAGRRQTGQYFLLLRTDGRLIGQVIGSSTSSQVIGTTTILPNVWYHAEFTYNGNGTVKLYLNGKLEGTATAALSGMNLTGSVFQIGTTAGSRYFPGTIDEVKIYDYARTPAQIAYDYNRGAPVAWYRFDECEGTTIKDHSGNGNNGTLNIGASGTQTSPGTCDSSGAWANGEDGKINSSMNFDGVDDYVSVPNNFNLGTGDFTLSAWYKGRNQIGSRGVVGSIHTNNVTGPVLQVSGNFVRAYVNGTVLLSNTIVGDENWHHLLMTRKGDTTYLYVDGKLDNSANLSTGSVNTDRDMFIGSFGTNIYLRDQIDDVRIYNYALSADQVKQVYNGGAVSFR